MKKINKKGMTLMELLISVALIATVLVFLFNLLINLRFNTEHRSYSRNNQINRISIIKTIEEDFMDRGVAINRIGNFDSGHNLVIYFNDGTNKTIKVGDNFISYGNEKWLINAENNNIKYDVSKLRVKKSSMSNQYKYLKIIIPVSTTSDIDDIELFYIGS